MTQKPMTKAPQLVAAIAEAAVSTRPPLAVRSTR